MFRNNRLLPGGQCRLCIYINNTQVPEVVRLLRMFSGDVLSLTVEDRLHTLEEIFLHTDIGGDWDYLPLRKDGGVFSFEYKVCRSGMFSFRFAAASDAGLCWEAQPYHRALCDPVSMNGLSMYTLIPNVSGKTADWRKMLPAIAGMGFNAIHLLPLTQMGSSESPYAASDLFAIDQAWAESMDDFKTFASEAAAQKLMLCLDIVLNHISVENPLCTEKAHWLIPDSLRADGLKRAGCWHHDSWISWEDLVLINYDHPCDEVRMEIFEYMRAYVLFWLEAAGAGNVIIRLDNLHSSNQRFIMWLIPEIRRIHPDVIILSEYFGAEEHLNEAVETFGLNLLMANSWEYRFAPHLQDYLLTLHESRGEARYLIEPTSHDTGAVPELFGTIGSSIPRYLCCALMGTGQTGIVQGFEQGAAAKINFIGRSPADEIGKQADFSAFIRDVNNLMRSLQCFREKGNIDFLETGCDSLIVCRRHCAEADYIIAANFDTGSAHDFYPGSADNYQFILSENALRSEGESRIQLEACGVCVLKSVIIE